jgi:uncharacterized protein YndB with AHSA1/START domain
MPRGGASIWIAAPPERVFDYVAEVENNPRWHSYVIESSWLDDGPMRVGRRGRQVSRLLGFRYTVEAEIAEWDPPRRVVWQTIRGDAAVRTACDVVPEGDGARLDLWTEGEFTNPLLRMLSPILIASLKRQALADLRRLASALARSE